MEVFLEYFCTVYATLSDLTLTKYPLRYNQCNNNQTKLTVENNGLPYPILNGKRQKRAKGIAFTRDIYRNCRRTYFQKGTEQSPDNFIALCSICQDWYHKKGMNIPLKVFRSDIIAEVWKCRPCK